MRYTDPRGVEWTASSEASAVLLTTAMTRYFTFRADALDAVDATLAADPDCPMGWVLRGYLLLLARKAELLEFAQDALRRAEALSAAATLRERLHMDALRAWCKARTMDAQRIWDKILEVTPHDLLALRVQHFHALFLGKPGHLARRAERTLKDWSDGIPGAGFALSTACMGLEEVDVFDEAERVGRRAAELEPDDLWALHSVAHVFEAEGRLDEGIAWMALPAAYWDGRGAMRHHLQWHEALFLYESGALEHTLDYYDTHLSPQESIGYLEMSNCAALLCRLEAAGLPCGERWDGLARKTEPLMMSRGLTFSDIHALIVFALAGEGEHLARLSASIAGYTAATDTYDSQAANAIAVPVSKALGAAQAGDAARAVETLRAAKPEFVRMGGSNAQRDLLDILLVDLARKAGKTDLALEEAERYLDVRPHSVPMRARYRELLEQ